MITSVVRPPCHFGHHCSVPSDFRYLKEYEVHPGNGSSSLMGSLLASPVCVTVIVKLQCAGGVLFLM